MGRRYSGGRWGTRYARNHARREVTRYWNKKVSRNAKRRAETTPESDASFVLITFFILLLLGSCMVLK